MSHDDFYVGYQKEAPPALASANRKRILIILVICTGLSAAFAIMQTTFGNGSWDLKEQAFEGYIEEGAVPVLVALAPDDISTFSRIPLVSPNKFGASDLVSGHHLKWVSLKGSLIERDGVKMIQVNPASIVPAAKSPAVEVEAELLGAHRFAGEIVDSKCYLGAMNPGNLKTHKQCAILCIQGGIPPVLLVRDSDGRATYLHLIDLDGSAVNDRVLDLVAEPIEVTGHVERQSNMLFLRADPASYRKL